MSDWDSQSEKPEWGVPERKEEKAGGNGKEMTSDRKLIEKLVLSMQTEQRRSRRWGIFFKLLTFVYLFALLFLIRFPMEDGLSATTKPHTAVIEVKGVIADDEVASASNIIGGLRDAFEAENVKGIVLAINSPGGSPVQAGYVYDEIHRLREKHPEKKVYAVISDIGASGAYYIAAGADEIYANQASLVGSIGVISGGFGFVRAMDKLGVERRLYTAGEHKAFLDPFSPVSEEEVSFWEGVLEKTHEQFINRVKKGRGDRLVQGMDDKLFSGLIWTGEQAQELGLVDGLGSAGEVARDVIGAEETVDYTRRADRFQRILRQLGSSAGESMADTLLQSRMELR
ncbi:S49 family peptidase [Marinobacteraceae bacterium S3BR75-40.1]